MTKGKELDPYCAIARSLGVLGERWTFLILREAHRGATRFSQFRDALGVSTDVLSERLATLVEYGVLDRRTYQAEGARARPEYTLTPAGRELRIVLASLTQWGDAHLPREGGPTIEHRLRASGERVRVSFVDGTGRPVPVDEVEAVPTAAYPAG